MISPKSPRRECGEFRVTARAQQSESGRVGGRAGGRDDNGERVGGGRVAGMWSGDADGDDGKGVTGISPANAIPGGLLTCGVPSREFWCLKTLRRHQARYLKTSGVGSSETMRKAKHTPILLCSALFPSTLRRHPTEDAEFAYQANREVARCHQTRQLLMARENFPARMWKRKRISEEDGRKTERAIGEDERGGGRLSSEADRLLRGWDQILNRISHLPPASDWKKDTEARQKRRIFTFYHRMNKPSQLSRTRGQSMGFGKAI